LDAGGEGKTPGNRAVERVGMKNDARFGTSEKNADVLKCRGNCCGQKGEKKTLQKAENKEESKRKQKRRSNEFLWAKGWTSGIDMRGEKKKQKLGIKRGAATRKLVTEGASKKKAGQRDGRLVKLKKMPGRALAPLR